jgi:hypothetical protein
MGWAVLAAFAAYPADPFQQPALLTSAGQSAEVQMVSVLAKRAGLDFSLVKLAQPEDLDQRKTLMVSIGASLKGLGAAGLDMAQETARVNALLEAASTQNIPLLALHLGGESRRGQLTDDLAAALIPKAALVIVVKSGNQDGFFTTLCEQHGVTLIEVERAPDALQPLQEAFQ